MLPKLTTLAIAIYLAGTVGAAAEQTMILSCGSNDCDRFLRATAREKQEYLAWAEGFVTGLNIGAIGNQRMTGLFWNQASISAWLNDYCSKNPHSGFVYAAMALRVSLGGRTSK
jgi:hypothetical protein